MSSRAWVAAGAIVGSAVVLVLLVRPQTASVPEQESSIAPAAPAPSPAVPEPDRAADAVVASAAPEGTPAPAPPRAPLPGEAPPTPAAPFSPVPMFVAANAQIFVAANAQTLSGGPFADWATEAVDPEWAPGARTQILTRIAEQPGLELISVNVECRTTMCFVEIARPGSGAQPRPDTPEAQVLDTLRIRAPQPAPGAEATTMQLVTSLGMQPRFIMTLAGEPGMQRSAALLMRPGVPPPEMAARHSAEPPAAAEPPRD